MSVGEGEDSDGPDEEDSVNVEFAIETLLVDYEQARIDRRRSIKQQSQVIISGTAAIGAVLGYTILGSSDGSFALPLLLAVPFIIGMAMVFSIEGEKNKRIMEIHAREIEQEITDYDIGVENFGFTELFEEKDKLEYPVHLWIIGLVPLFIIVPLILFSLPVLSSPEFSEAGIWAGVFAVGLVALTLAIYVALQSLPDLPE